MASNEVLKVMRARKSCKDFLPELPSASDLDAIIEAGVYAPSGKGLQSPIVLCVTDKKVRDELSRLNAKYLGRDMDPFYGAPAVLAVLADTSVPTHVCDGSVTIENMILAAASLGLGACWIHRAKEVFADEEGKKILEAAGVKGDFTGVGFCVVGRAKVHREQDVARKDGRVFKI